MSDNAPENGCGRALIISASDFRRDNRALKIARALSDGGWEVTCLGMVTKAGDPTHEDLGYARLIRAVTSKVPFQIEDARDDAGTLSDKSTAIPLWRRVMLFASRVRVIDDLRHYLGRMRENRVFSETVRDERFELVLACNPVTLPCGVAVKRRDQARLIYDVREVWTEQSDRTTSLYRFLYRTLERRLVRHVDAVTAVNALVGADLKGRYPYVDPIPMLNGASECMVPAVNVHSPLRLLFQGRFAADRGLLQLVAAMAGLRGRAVLVLQGFEGVETELRQTVRRLALEDVVVFEEPVEPSETVSAAAGHDVGLIAYPPTSLNLLYSSPNKLFDYLGGGLAVASTDIPFSRSIIEEYACGVLFDANSPEKLIAALEELVASPERVARMKAGAHQACLATCWDVQARTLRRLAVDLTGGP